MQEKEYPLGRAIHRMLPGLLRGIQKNYELKPSALFGIWAEVAGEKYGRFTQVISFEGGVLYVKVSSSTVFSLLSTQEKPRLLKLIREKAKGLVVNNIVFRR